MDLLRSMCADVAAYALKKVREASAEDKNELAEQLEGVCKEYRSILLTDGGAGEDGE